WFPNGSIPAWSSDLYKEASKELNKYDILKCLRQNVLGKEEITLEPAVVHPKAFKANDDFYTMVPQLPRHPHSRHADNETSQSINNIKKRASGYRSALHKAPCGSLLYIIGKITYEELCIKFSKNTNLNKWNLITLTLTFGENFNF
ncbi:Uncharacterized protein FWK35_00026718, partial [Aphis craccivora]